MLRTLFCAVLATACGGKTSAPSTPPSAPADDYGAKVLADLRGIADRECGCKNDACSKQTSDDRQKYYDGIDRSKHLTDDQNKAVDVEEARFHTCQRQIEPAAQ